MTVVKICGWETQDASEGSASSGTVSISTSVKRTGQASVRTNPTTTGVGNANVNGLAASGAAGNVSLATTYVRAYFRYDTKPASNDEEFLVVSTGRGTKLALRLDSAGKIAAYDSSNTIITTGSTVLSSGTWYRIGVKCGTGASAAWEVLIDGNAEISGTNNLSVSNAALVAFGKGTNRNGQTVDFYFDDVCIDDAGHPPAGAIEVMQPDAAGNYQNWTIGAGSGSNWQQVDELPNDGDTTYLLGTLGTTLAETESLESAASAGVSGTVNVVQAFAVVKQDTFAGSVNLRLRSGSTDSDASSFSSISSYVLLQKVFATDPNTSAAWGLSALDSIETGCLNNDSFNFTRLTTTGAMVDFTVAADGSEIVAARSCISFP